MGRERTESGSRVSLTDVVLAAATYFALSIDLNEHSVRSLMTNLVSSFQAFRIERVFYFFAFLFLYSYVRRTRGKDEGSKKTRAFLALLFSFFMVFGRSFELTDSWRLVTNIRNGQLIKALAMYAGYTLLFYHLTALVFRLLDRGADVLASGNGPAQWTGRRYPKAIAWYIRSLHDRPFLTLFLTLLIASVPNLVMSYPARFMGDTRAQIVQAYSELQDTGINYMKAGMLLKENVFINQHHPIAHTLLIHACLLLGDAAAGSMNAGLFLFALLQDVIETAAFAYAGSVAVRKTGVSPGGMLAITGYALIHPVIANLLLLITKDTIYAAFLLVYAACIYRILAGEEGRGLVALTGLSMAGMILFRSEGVYVLAGLSFIAFLINRDTRRFFLCSMVSVVLFSVLVTRALYPALGFTPASRKEMLCVPIQQTARYVRDHGGEVTEEEREAVNKVLKYQSIVKRYDPNHADPVKNYLFREEASGEDLAGYFRAWAGMFLKHPGTFIQATLNNTYRYYYPGSARISAYTNAWSKEKIDIANKELAKIGKKVILPDRTKRIRALYDKVIEALQTAPGFDLLFTPALYFWTVIACLAWAACRRNRRGCILFCLPALIYGICLLGPRNGEYSRYQFPVILILPFLVLMALQLKGAGRKKENNG